MYQLTEDWKADQIRWVNNGVKQLPKKSPVVKKTYFLLDTENGQTDGFRKHVYQLLDSQQYTIIQYIGNQSLVSQFPHRNATNSSRIFFENLSIDNEENC